MSRLTLQDAGDETRRVWEAGYFNDEARTFVYTFDRHVDALLAALRAGEQPPVHARAGRRGARARDGDHPLVRGRRARRGLTGAAMESRSMHGRRLAQTPSRDRVCAPAPVDQRPQETRNCATSFLSSADIWLIEATDSWLRAMPSVVMAAPSATPAMFAAISPEPVAASETDLVISLVVAVGSSTALAMVSWNPLI